MARPTRMIEWIGVNWADLEDDDVVWIRRASGSFKAVGPFLVVSVFERKLQTENGTTFRHKGEDLLQPRSYERG